MYLHIEDGQDLVVVKSEPTQDDLAAVEAGDLKIVRFGPGRFEELIVDVKDSDGEEDEIEYESTWSPV